MNGLILLCAGSGQRMAGVVADKVLAEIAGMPVWQHSLEAFREAGFLHHVVWVVRDVEQREHVLEALEAMPQVPWQNHWTFGGSKRQDSVMAGLTAIPAGVEVVFIHDSARPLIQASMLEQLLETVSRTGNATLAHRVTDTIKMASVGGSTAPVQETLEDLQRDRLWAMETPQVFRLDLILRAYQEVIHQGATITDDTAALAFIGEPVTLLENPCPNPKLTRPQDIPYLEYLLATLK